jgi:energy-coupling factor transport system substrate-specific component
MSWLPASLMILAVALALGFAWYERSHPSARILALVGALAALAVVGRIAFAALPNVKPTTDIVFFSGFALGGAPGFAVGALAALVSNFFFGQGPWTPWQMAAWGGVGLFGALLGRLARGRELGRVPLAIACALAGLFFGAVMDLFQWTLGEPHTVAAYGAVSARSLGFNIAHATGNVVFCLLIGPAFVRALQRYQRRFEVSWEVPQPAAAVSAVVVALVVAASFMQPASADAASPSARAVSYLRGAQNSDGGFGGGPGQGSNQLHSGWVALGFASAGVNPRDVQKGSNSLFDYLRSGQRSFDDTGELERTILVVRASGLDPRDWSGRDLVAELQRKRRGDGSYGTINWTAFGIMALRASGASVSGKSVSYLVKQQNGDGGYGFSTRATSDADDTGAVLQGLAAGGKRSSSAVRRAVAYLKRTQHSDGGWGQMPSQPSNSQSTAWAVQGLVAAGRNPARFKRGGRSPLQFIASLQQSNGSFRYSKRSAQTPVWVTAQALTALQRKAFPLKAAALKGRSSSGGGSAGGGSATAEEKARERRARAQRKKAGEEDAAGDSTAADGSPGGAASPGAPGVAGKQTSETLGGDDSGTGDLARTIGIVVAAALILMAVGWWRMRRGSDPLAGD